MAEDRLISANEFKRFLCGCCNVLNGGEPCEPAECNVMLVIDQQPTIDAVEVVHGEWIVCGDGEYVPFMCSACGKTTSWYHAQTANYCPNCGAKMDVPVIIKDESFVVKEETKK